MHHISIDRNRTALIIMDYQNEIVAMLPREQQETLLHTTSRLLESVRQAGLPVIYVVVSFREGYPEVSPRNKQFGAVKEAKRLIEGKTGAEIHPGVAPKAGEVVVTKRRVGAFPNTELKTILKAKGIDALILLGISTSGCVLSTVRWAADEDYELFVVSDGCGDPDQEVHRVLMEKVFPRQATVATARELISVLA